MIIFGTRGIKSTMKQGQFLCPQCATEQNYKHKKVTNFFTLYFIPIIPLGSAGDYVECQTCKGTFVSRVLDYDPKESINEFQSQYEKAMRHSMILMMLADGHIDDEEKKIVHQIINNFGHHDITLSELDALIEEVEAAKEPVETYLKKISPSINSQGKEIIIKCGISVAMADGHFDANEKDLLLRMAMSMEMTESHVKGILADLAPAQPEFSEN